MDIHLKNNYKARESTNVCMRDGPMGKSNLGGQYGYCLDQDMYSTSYRSLKVEDCGHSAKMAVSSHPLWFMDFIFIVRASYRFYGVSYYWPYLYGMP